MSQECGQSLEAEDEKENSSSLEPLEKNTYPF